MATMKAAVRHEYGTPEVLRIADVDRPVPRDDDVLVRVRAVAVTLGDWEILTRKPRYVSVLAGLFGPKPRYAPIPRPDGGSRRMPKFQILGSDFSGTVEAVGALVDDFAPGDEVFGQAGMGAMAEYVTARASRVAQKPAAMTHEQAAALPEATGIAVVAVQTKGRVQKGQTVLVNGAGGGAGTIVVRLAKSLGAEVTGVDGPDKLDHMRSVGADRVMDYTTEDFTKTGDRYDVIVDLVATRSAFEAKRALTPGGLYLMAGGSGRTMIQTMPLAPLVSRIGNGRVGFILADANRDILETAIELFETGTVTPVIDGPHPLVEAAAALRRVGEGAANGRVVLTP